MNSIERFYATINREKVDRPAAWLGMPDIHSQPALFEYYGVKNMHELKLAIGDDFYAVEVPYQSPTASAIYAALTGTWMETLTRKTGRLRRTDALKMQRN